MKITLSSQQTFNLGHRFAEDIHSEIIGRRLNRMRAPGETIDWRTPGQLAEMCAAVRSIEDRWERREFISAIRYCLRKLKEEKGTPHRWQDRVAQHSAFQNQQAA